MFNPLTQLNKIFDLATERNLSGTDQLVLLHLYNKFNRARWPETILVRDAELHELCRLYDTDGKPSSIYAIRNAKARLKKHGLIDFTAGKGSMPTEYRLIQLYPTDTPTDTPASSYIRVREDYQDVKTYSSSTSPTRARAQAGAPVNEKAEPAEELARYWSRTLGGARLSFEDISWLDSLVQKHGYEWTKGLLDEAYNSNGNPYGLAPKWLKLIYDRRLNPPKSKGGRKREQSHRPAAGRRYDLSGTDREPDWLRGSGSKTQGAFGGDNAANLQTIRR